MKKSATSWCSPGDTSLLTQLKGWLRQSGLKAKRGLGQHFLIDEPVLRLIVSAAGLKTDDVVVEVGPGPGILTRELARRAGWVIAIELDSRLAAVLRRTLAAENVTIINDDILNIEPSNLSRELAGKFPAVTGSPYKYKVVANLPYYITSPVLRHFLEASVKPQSMLVMVQEEVAEAIVAGPGRMSLLSVSVQFYGEADIIAYIPAPCFYPAPEVDSAVLRINVHPQPAVAVTDVVGFFGLVRAGFSASRKQIANSLALGLALPKTEVLPMLEAAGILSRRRAETLALDEWARLWQVFSGGGA